MVGKGGYASSATAELPTARYDLRAAAQEQRRKMKWTYLVALVELGVSGQVYSDGQNDNVCERNVATCKVVCYNHNKQDEGTNTCNADNLDYSCICRGGYTPSASSKPVPARLTA